MFNSDSLARYIEITNERVNKQRATQTENEHRVRNFQGAFDMVTELQDELQNIKTQMMIDGALASQTDRDFLPVLTDEVWESFVESMIVSMLSTYISMENSTHSVEDLVEKICADTLVEYEKEKLRAAEMMAELENLLKRVPDEETFDEETLSAIQEGLADLDAGRVTEYNPED